MNVSTEELVREALKGNSDALESVVLKIQDRIYGLAIRMLWHPEDAEDASQEILVKIVTHLGSFRFESSFETWCFRIAVNHLLTTRKRRAELLNLTFPLLEQDIDKGLEYCSNHSTPEPEQDLLVKEVMIGCVQGVMLCLDRAHRIVYVLGEVYRVDSQTGSHVLEITPEAFRKRLSRSRGLVRNFLARHCGLVDTSNECTCKRQIPYAIKTGIVNPRRLLFAGYSCQSYTSAESDVSCDTDERVAALLRQPQYEAPNRFVEKVRALVRAEFQTVRPHH
ncbi:RNA polymerase sigma factor [Desulfomonile tiedjei]|uniref:RNA polymerase, sigma subunit, ECF family n=1 Tax=Desulfomonile tiedjei (strain ATCC 49306 / DSM 6799 / DCB-1) TaxID=706587 RepID=I4C4E9_DESTA|nr:sigma-70 family RNA polymerase sigma factor [Desulfomonile tiedjei]AFM24440.1 RNA polymerase, sigma subunit, ECF family [Desulfomonile tiedjei DSM 6799]